MQQSQPRSKKRERMREYMRRPAREGETMNLPEGVLREIEYISEGGFCILRDDLIRVALLAQAEAARKCAGICEALEKLLRDYEVANPFGRLGFPARASLTTWR